MSDNEVRKARCSRCRAEIDFPFSHAAIWCDLCRALENEKGILSGRAIARAVQLGLIEIDPFNPEQLNPASYDLTVGKRFTRYALGGRNSTWLDATKDNPVTEHEAQADSIYLYPGEGYLFHTNERVFTEKFVPIVDGKSSIGRLFVQVHMTAGYGDPGFNGQYTLEVVVTHPTVIKVGMRFAQIRFHTLVGEPELYHGNYTGEASMGPVPSRSWKQFTKKEE